MLFQAELPIEIPSDLSQWNRGELQLARLCVELGAAESGGSLSRAEEALVRSSTAERFPHSERDDVANRILAGCDPLGDRFCEIRSASVRRSIGAFYTPTEIVEPMTSWVLRQNPSRVVDPGCGSGRFLASVARRDSGLEFVGVYID